jgi:hypothetical protein
MADPADHPFRWEDLDQRLIKPELQLLTDKMQKRAVDGKRRVVLESSKMGNAGSYFPLFFDFQEQLADEWVQGLYTLYRDAPNRQNRSVTPAFIRDVGDRGIFPFIAHWTATVLGEVSVDVARTRKQRNEVAEGEWVRSMRRFATRWRDELEAEAVKWEYRISRREGENLQQSRDRAAIREMDTEQASQGVLTCKKRLEEVTALLNAKTQALGQMDAKGDRNARRRNPITQAIRALSNQKANLEWRLNEYSERAQIPSPSPLEPFVHSPDYRAITVNGESYCLTSNQALVVQFLHEQFERGVAGVAQATLLERIGSPSSRLRDSFRSGDGPKLWGKLIVRVEKTKDMFCLRLSAQQKGGSKD